MELKYMISYLAPFKSTTSCASVGAPEFARPVFSTRPVVWSNSIHVRSASPLTQIRAFRTNTRFIFTSSFCVQVHNENTSPLSPYQLADQTRYKCVNCSQLYDCDRQISCTKRSYIQDSEKTAYEHTGNECVQQGNENNA